MCDSSGHRAVLVGLNLIGLKRKKIKLSEIEDIKSAYKILFMSKLTLEEAMSKLDESRSPYVEDITTFIKHSQRDITRPNTQQNYS
ncbi:MAG: hypothetical protein LE180_05025 [Endomicrobium sp.]|uniref:hypothetical protein n=1 Tax=Candidatus Endomicrobiellum pyrsonymphae TaxID=1408203 RepID=UPI0035824699|nr:hypothetical protein [Endomicrobium sp.]